MKDRVDTARIVADAQYRSAAIVGYRDLLAAARYDQQGRGNK